MKNMCESCGMPLAKDPMGGGKEKDGTLSTQYCSYCYQDGAFVSEPANVQDFQKIVIEAMVSQGFLRPFAWILTRGIPRLPRWKKDSE